MTQNLVSLNFTADQLKAVDTALTDLETQLSGLIAMNAAQKRSMKRMGEKSEAFCRQTLRVLDQNRQIVPPNAGLESALSDLQTLDELLPRMVRLARLSTRAADTRGALGGNMMKVALRGYKLLELTGREEGLHDLRQELAARFARSPRPPEAKAA